MELLPTELLADALRVSVALAGPAILASCIAGLVVGLFQTITQVQDQALSLAIRLGVVLLTLMVSGAWSFQLLRAFALRLWSAELPL